MLKRKDKFDAIIIETTGMADPAPVAQTFFMDEESNLKSQISNLKPPHPNLTLKKHSKNPAF